MVLRMKFELLIWHPQDK